MSTDVARLKNVNEKEPVGLELLISAMVAQPDDEKVQVFMADNGFNISLAKIAVYRRRGAEAGWIGQKFLERRKELLPVLEGDLTDDMLEGSRVGTMVAITALKEAQKRLEDGADSSPAKTARDAFQVVAQMTDKRLAMEGRPTQIVEKRSTDEILRALEAKGVVKTIEATSEELPALPEAEHDH